MDSDEDGMKYLMYLRPVGSVGQMLFQYASTLAISNHTKHSVVFDTEMEIITRIFPRIKLCFLTTSMSRMSTKVSLTEAGPWTLMNEHKPYEYDELLFKLPSRNIIIEDTLISFRYFEKITGFLYNQLLSHVSEKLLQRANSFRKTAQITYEKTTKEHAPESVCVHVRRKHTKKRRKRAKAELHPRIANLQEILHAMHYMSTKHKHAIFIVISDDKEWCRKHLKGKHIYISNFTSVEEDFVLASGCNHMIMTVGTFGWWAAWLTSQRGGTVMYYPFQTVYHHHMKAYFQPNYFPSTWIPYDRQIVLDEGASLTKSFK